MNFDHKLLSTLFKLLQLFNANTIMGGTQTYTVYFKYVVFLAGLEGWWWGGGIFYGNEIKDYPGIGQP